MNYLSSDIFYPLLFIVIPLYLFFRISCRYLITGFLDIANINLLYIAFAMTGLIGILIKHFNFQLFQIVIACFLWLIASFFGGYASKLSSKKIITLPNIKSKLIITNNAKLVDRCTLFLTVIIWILYLYPIFSSGFLTGATVSIDSRYLILEQNKILTYFYSAALYAPPILIYRNFGKISAKRFLLYLFPFFLIQILTLSKTAFMYPLIAYALYRSLLVRDGRMKPQSFSKEILTITICGMIVFMIFFLIATYLTTSTINPEDFIFYRLYGSFDALIMLSEMPFNNFPNLSLVQLYLAPFLKVFGLFDQPYNAANYYLAVEYMGFPKDHAGLLPNNNHIMEIFLSFGTEMRIIMCVLSGFLYGYLYWKSITYIQKGGYFLLPFSVIYSSPFAMLIDGQGWVSTVLNSIMLAFFVFLFILAKKFFSYIFKAKQQLSISI